MSFRSWWSKSGDREETEAKRGLTSNYGEIIIKPLKLKIMMRSEVKYGKTKGPNRRLLEEALDQRTKDRDSMSPEEEKAVGIFMDWRIRGQITKDEAIFINRYLNLGEGDQIEAGYFDGDEERVSIQDGELSPKTPLGFKLAFCRSRIFRWYKRCKRERKKKEIGIHT